jgi:hypothetical protein
MKHNECNISFNNKKLMKYEKMEQELNEMQREKILVGDKELVCEKTQTLDASQLSIMEVMINKISETKNYGHPVYPLLTQLT